MRMVRRVSESSLTTFWMTVTGFKRRPACFKHRRLDNVTVILWLAQGTDVAAQELLLH